MSDILLMIQVQLEVDCLLQIGPGPHKGLRRLKDFILSKYMMLYKKTHNEKDTTVLSILEKKHCFKRDKSPGGDMGRI